MDNLESLEIELLKATENLTELGRRMKKAATTEAELHSNYEALKNGYLIEMYVEESEKGIKRTVDIRTAMYRLKFKDERMRWLLAKADFESDRDLFKGLGIKISAIQSLINIEREKMKLV